MVRYHLSAFSRLRIAGCSEERRSELLNDDSVSIRATHVLILAVQYLTERILITF